MAVCYESRRASECATLTWLLVGDVREMLQDRLDAEAIRWIKPLLDALIQTMCEQCQIEKSPGYFEDVLESFPNWSNEIDAVLGEHAELCHALENLRYSLVELQPQHSVHMYAKLLEVELQQWVEAMMEHARRDRELLQNVWYTEIGGEG